MHSAIPYEYESIQNDQLRLCRFVQDATFMSAELETFPAGGSRPYVALSYTWGVQQGSPDDSWPLQIGQQQLPVLGSLKPFVQALKAKGTVLDGTWWWIDSICINQANTQERDQHVRRMKQIYQDAQEVIVWLGPQSDDSDCALDFIQLLNRLDKAQLCNEVLRKTLLQDRYREEWHSLKQFLLRKWWGRVWTIQEFVIPANVTFWCGPRQLTRDTLFVALLVADRCNGPPLRDSVALRRAFNRRRASVLYESMRGSDKTLNLSLTALAAYFCVNEATDDRDRIYGLSGLAIEDHGLEINYEWTVDEVYLRFAQSFITKHKSLDIIPFASLFAASPGSSLPSWAPDWRAKVQPLVVPLMTSQSSSDYLGNLRPPRCFNDGSESASYSATGSQAAKYSFEGSTLLAYGYMIDAVDGIAGNRNFGLVQSSAEHSTPSAAAIPPKDILERICRSLVLDRGDRYLQWRVPAEVFAEEFYHDFIQLCLLLTSETSACVSRQFRDWFDSTRRLRFHGISFEDMLRRHQAQSLIDPVPNQDEWIQDSFYGRFFDVVERMSLRVMTSRNGRIGMVPERTVKGDLICLLFGCSVPLVLRESGCDSRFTVVGECFLDGCMYGEAAERKDVAEVMFRIV